jgi:hypothetical protein
MIDCSDPSPQKCTGFWDRTFKDDGTPAHFFWDVATIDSKLFKPPVTIDPTDPAYDHSTTASFDVGPSYTEIDHITARIRTRALAFRVLDDLVSSGDLDASVASQLQTLDAAGATRTWTKATAGTGAAMFTNCNPN